MALVPILLIPQLIFAGALVPLDRMLAPAKVIAQLMIGKWSLELAGSITDLGPRFSAQFPPSVADPYRSAFGVVPWVPWVEPIGFSLVMLSATVVVQKRKDLL